MRRSLKRERLHAKLSQAESLSLDQIAELERQRREAYEHAHGGWRALLNRMIEHHLKLEQQNQEERP